MPDLSVMTPDRAVIAPDLAVVTPDRAVIAPETDGLLRVFLLSDVMPVLVVLIPDLTELILADFL